MLCASCMLLSSISILVVADIRMPNTNLYALTSDVTYVSVEVSKNVVQYYLDLVYEEEQFEKNEWDTLLDVLDNSYFSKTNFLSHMETMYDYLSPTIIGVSSLSQFRNGVNDYMYDTLGRRISYDEFTVSRYSTTVDGLIDGLIEKVPVALLVLDVENGSSGDLEGSDGDSFAMHWITITKYFKDGNTSDEQIAFSSWGYRYSVPLYDFWYIYDIEGGIYYF